MKCVSPGVSGSVLSGAGPRLEPAAVGGAAAISDPSHCSIENGLPWVVDVTWREDDLRTHHPILAQNLVAMTRLGPVVDPGGYEARQVCSRYVTKKAGCGSSPLGYSLLKVPLACK